LQKWLELDLRRIDPSEFKRVEWMWRRKPKPFLGEGVSGYILLILVASLLLLIPHLGILFAAAWCLTMVVAIADDTVRFARWRREYESGMVRVIRSSRKAK
jgi:murein DD-endopeptidase MepM/ murein hydrolase activator NlpD